MQILPVATYSGHGLGESGGLLYSNNGGLCAWLLCSAGTTASKFKI